MKHLVSNETNEEVTDYWCGEPGAAYSHTRAVAEVDCDDCLMSVLDLAEEVRERRAELLAAKGPPLCGCRPGSHPARENYLEVQGPRCELGWLIL